MGDLFGGGGLTSAQQIQKQNDQEKLKYGVNDVSLDPNALAQQQNFVSALQAQANGVGPSAAGQLLKNQADQNNANALSMAASQRGVNSGGALRQALQQNAISNQQSGQQAALARTQEQLGATGMLGNQLNGMQQQGLNVQAQNQNSALASKGLAAQAQGQKNAQNQDLLGGILKGGATALSFLAAKGGMVPGFADGGTIMPVSPLDPSGPSSAVGKYLSAPTQRSSSIQDAIGEVGKTFQKRLSPPTNLSAEVELAHGGQVPAMVSPGERYLSPREVEKVAEGKKSAMAAGKKIPGEAKVKGDSYANDTVSKTLESGGIVLPRHVTQAKDAPEKAAAFVRAILAKQGLKK